MKLQIITFTTLLAFGANAAGQVIDIAYLQPNIDRWMYPFNTTPGVRGSISVFGNFDDPDFDNRDGQFILCFNTDGDVPTSLGANAYTITAARVTAMMENQPDIVYDPTEDPWQSYLGEGEAGAIEDADVGRPITMFGVDFRYGFTATTFEEDTEYKPGEPFPLGQELRSAYAMSEDAAGVAGAGPRIDVSNNTRNEFDPIPFAIGQLPGVNPGDPILLNDVFEFELDVANPLVQAYLREAMDQGVLCLSITSLHFVEVMGGEFPAFYTKENFFVIEGFADAASLELTVEVNDVANPADLDGDGSVGPADLAILLGSWGACPGCPADLNGDGAVGPADLAVLLGGWG